MFLSEVYIYRPLICLILVTFLFNLYWRYCFVFMYKKTAAAFIAAVMLLLFTRTLPMDGGMAEDHRAPKAGQLPRVWTRGRKETESRQRVSGAKSP